MKTATEILTEINKTLQFPQRTFLRHVLPPAHSIQSQESKAL